MQGEGKFPNKTSSLCSELVISGVISIVLFGPFSVNSFQHHGDAKEHQAKVHGELLYSGKRDGEVHAGHRDDCGG